jgi:hypothetical protein
VSAAVRSVLTFVCMMLFALLVVVQVVVPTPVTPAQVVPQDSSVNCPPAGDR